LDKWKSFHCHTGREKNAMNVEEFTRDLSHVLEEYELGDRGPQRVLEIITSLFNGFAQSSEALPASLERIQMVVDSWNQGDRSDIDALATIVALATQL
jgi:hypothetical protein